MRKHLLIAVCAFLLCGCATHRKVVETTVQRTDSTGNATFDSVTSSQVYTDTTMTETGNTIVTEIIFDTTGGIRNDVTIGKDGTVHATGNIRHVRKTESGHQVKRNGIAERKDSTAVRATANTDRHTMTVMHGKPAQDPKRWRYIAIIVVSILVAVLLAAAWWKRSFLRTWLNDSLQKLRRND